MNLTEKITEQLKRVCGLDARSAVMPIGINNGIFQDVENDRTIFEVSISGKKQAFEICGCGEDKLITALLAREYVCNYVSKVQSAEPVRDYLNGDTDNLPSVNIGKCDYYVVAVSSDKVDRKVLDYLVTMADGDDFTADMTGGITAFCKRSDSDYRSAGELAAVLIENLSEEIKGNIKIGVGGTAHGVSELPQYYGYAKSALVRGAEFDPDGNVYSYKEYALIKSLAELSVAEKEKYVKTTLDRNYRDVVSDSELMTAADAFIRHSLNISEASRSLYVHRNTLIYRLDKIEKLTGLNIRSFNDAMAFRVACIIYKMLY